MIRTGPQRQPTVDLAEVFFAAIAVEPKQAKLALVDEALGNDLQWRELLISLLDKHQSIVAEFPDDVSSEDGDLASEQPESTNAIPRDLLSPSRYAGSLGRLGSYEIVHVIAVGGMSVVVEAFDPYLKRIVAIKILATELSRLPRARQRFQREASVAAAIDHEHVTKIFAVDQQQGVPYLAMELIPGCTLASHQQAEGSLSVDEILRIGGQIAQGLAAIHKQGLVHRDLKPDNVLLEAPRGDVKITDFGVALSIGSERLTRTGEMNGTPEFMSPQQAQGQAVDQRSDLFSLGVLLYALATGQSPFEAPTPLAAMKRVCDDTPQPIGQLRPDLPDWLQEVISQLLEKAPNDRLLSARQVADLFTGDGAVKRGQPASPMTSAQRTKRFLRSLVAGTLILAALGYGLVISLGLATDPSLPLANQFHFLVMGIARVTVEVDDPQVESVISGPPGSISGSGTFECWLPPGAYELRAYKDGNEIDRQSFLLSDWDAETIVLETSGTRNEFEDLAPTLLNSL